MRSAGKKGYILPVRRNGNHGNDLACGAVELQFRPIAGQRLDSRDLVGSCAGPVLDNQDIPDGFFRNPSGYRNRC